MKTFIYYNLHKKCWSLKSLDGSNKGRVYKHCDEVYVENVVFKVSEAGRQRVLREKQKNVHAGVVGYVKTFENLDLTNCISLTYDPYKYSSFVIRDSLQPIYCADKVFMKDKKVFMLK